MPALLLLLISFLPNLLFAMNQKNQPRSYFGEIFHYIDKTKDPIHYITEVESINLCEMVLRYNPACTNSKEFTMDESCLENMHRVFEREQTLLCEIERIICVKDSPAELEQIISMKKKQTALYCSVLDAVIEGYLQTKVTHSKENIGKLLQHTYIPPKDTNKLLDTPSGSIQENPDIKNFSEETGFVSLAALQQLILHDNPGYVDKFVNLIRKTMVNPIGYLTENKSHIVCKAALHFSPDHQYHLPDWRLNPRLPLHCTIIHNAFERVHRLLDTIESAIKRNCDTDILKLYPNELLTSQEKNNHAPAGFFSPACKAIIAGYLKKTTMIKLQDFKKDSPSNPSSTTLKEQLPPPPTNPPPAIPNPYLTSPATLSSPDPHASLAKPLEKLAIQEKL